jgi:sulfatase modifying factor 1
VRQLLGTGCWTFCLCLLSSLASAAPPQQPSPEKLAQLIEQLDDDKFAQREVASQQLQEFGESVLPALRRAVASAKDDEVRSRAEQIMRAIMLDCRKSAATGMELELVDADVFQMGSPERETGRRPDEKQHRVRTTRPFLMGTYEVRQDQYEQVMKVNPSWFSKTGDGKDKIVGEDPRAFPVERVTWYNAVDFCNRLSKLDGYPPYYELTDVEREGDALKRCKVAIAGGNGYRLPTEAEWELACRAGSERMYSYGNGNTGREANMKQGMGTGYGAPPAWKSLDRTAKVGSYRANRFGLYEMHGNVGEWCWDWYDKDYYAASPKDDPMGPAAGEHRVLRGGSWLVNEASSRSASRFFQSPQEGTYFSGFRVARTP